MPIENVIADAKPNIAKLQSNFMDAVIKEARSLVTTDPNYKPNFDPQGRILVEVKVDKIAEKDREILKTFSEKKPQPQVITVSLDINGVPELSKLREKFYTEIETRLMQHTSDASKIMEQLKKDDFKPGSINPLQQEFHLHLSLATRTWERFFDKQFPGKFPDKQLIQEAYQKALNEINFQVLEAYAKALVKAQTQDGLNISTLNQELDKARETISVYAHDSLFQNILDKTKVSFSKEDLSTLEKNKEKNKKGITHFAETTTATKNDFILTSAYQRTATWISGSENTAHHRALGRENIAHRQLIVHPYINGEVETNTHPRIQVRTSSLDVKEPEVKKKPQIYIKDIAEKLNEFREIYNLNENLPESAEEDINYPKAFIYNLHTASNDYSLGVYRAGDSRGNEQTKGAELIIKGAHLYNQEQDVLGPQKPVFCFVQNLSVNGYGDTLGYGSGNALKEETTLMAELALLHTLYPSCALPHPNEQQYLIKLLIVEYSKFLKEDYPRIPYFSQSKYGKGIIQDINDLKETWKQQEKKPGADVYDNATNSLKNIIANNLHFSHDYAKVIQALSIFVEKASIAGCKSGNERAQAVNGRVAVLDQVSFTAPAEQDKETAAIMQELKTLNDAGINVDQITTNLKDSINISYNTSGLNLGASPVSPLDQGAASKLKAKVHDYHFDRNYGEDKGITALHADHADKMQAHKGMSTLMLNAAVKGIKEQLQNIDSPTIKAQKVARGEIIENIGRYKLKDVVIERTPIAKRPPNSPDPYPTKAREAFLNYLNRLDTLSRPKMDPAKRTDLINEGKQAKAAISMEKLLGKEGVKLYLAALKEERNSPEFKAAIKEKATEEKITGAPFQKRFVAQILGPAGVGKTGAVIAMLKKLESFLPRATGKSGSPELYKSDGGDTRDVSQMRDWLLNHATDMGYTGIENMYAIGDEPILDDVKSDIEKEALQNPNASLIIPTTSFKSNITPANADEIIIQVMGKREVTAFQQVSRTYKTNWAADAKTHAESKAPPWWRLVSYLKGKWGAKKGVEHAKEKGGMVFCVINDSILVKETPPGTKQWHRTKDNDAKGILQISKRVFDKWVNTPEEERIKIDLRELVKNTPKQTIITTPELLVAEGTVKELKKLTANLVPKRPHLTGAKGILAQIKDLQTIWQEENWTQYQNDIDNIRNNIDYLLEEHPPLSENIQEELIQLKEQLLEARKRVPDDKFVKILKNVETKKPDGSFLKIANEEMEKIGSANILHTLVTKDTIDYTPPNPTEGSAKPNTEASYASSVITKYQNVKLENNQLIQATVTFDRDNTKKGILVQNHQGTVSDVTATETKLTADQKTLMAVEQAKMFLSNWHPDGGDIIIRGADKEMSDKLYAALLLLKSSHAKLKDIPIRSFVAGCNGPGKFDSESRFINRHLGSEHNGPLNKAQREEIKTEMAALVSSTASKQFKARLAADKEKVADKNATVQETHDTQHTPPDTSASA